MQGERETIDAAFIEALLARLEAAPRHFMDALSMAESDTLAWFGTEDGAWSPLDILAHVRASHGIMQPRIYYVLARDNPNLEAYDDAAWRKVARLDTLPVIDSLTALRLNREELVRMLLGLSLADWGRMGTHETLGPISLYGLANALADHDDEHIAQLQATVKSGAV